MVYITGDTHGNFLTIAEFCGEQKTTADDVLIILGDAGINYYGKNVMISLNTILPNCQSLYFVSTETMNGAPKL